MLAIEVVYPMHSAAPLTPSACSPWSGIRAASGAARPAAPCSSAAPPTTRCGCVRQRLYYNTRCTIHCTPDSVYLARYYYPSSLQQVWAMNTGRCIHTLTGHNSTVRCVRLCGNIAVSGSRDATLRVWDAAAGVCLGALSGHTDSVRWCVIITRVLHCV